jgi:hypothetical protein
MNRVVSRIQLKSRWRIFSEKSWKSFCLSGRFVFLVEVAKAFDPAQADLSALKQPEHQSQGGVPNFRNAGQRASGYLREELYAGKPPVRI